MKEQDFDEIGKRLYDLEADPPDDGWKRIGGTLNPTGRWFVWIRKYWWIPLVLIVPVISYVGYHELSSGNATAESKADVTQAPSALNEGNPVTPGKELPAGVAAESSSAHEGTVRQETIAGKGEQPDTSSELNPVVAERRSTLPEDSSLSKAETKSNSGAGTIREEASIVKGLAGENKAANGSPSNQPATASGDGDSSLDNADRTIHEESPVLLNSNVENKGADSKAENEQTINDRDSKAPEKADNHVLGAVSIATTSNIAKQSADKNPSKANAVRGNDDASSDKIDRAGHEDAVVVSTSTVRNNDSDAKAWKAVVNGEQASVTGADEGAREKTSIATGGNNASNLTAMETKNTSSTSIANQGDGLPDKVATPVAEGNTNAKDAAQEKISTLNGGGNESIITVKHDTVQVIETKTEKEDSVLVKREAEKPEEDSRPTWRMNVFVMPQYVTRKIQPLATDEVFVTEVEGNTSPTRSGLEFGMGAARSLSDNWYLDARLSYNNLREDMAHTYATGEVDTLVSVRQSDGSINVTPVYHVINREIKSAHHYANVSFGATYYFWQRAKTRFNLSAAVDMHYLLSVKTQENVNGEWVNLDDAANKINFGFTIGAGYNINLYKGVELMIRPSWRYFAGNIKNAAVPYTMSKQSMGIHFMLSKTIGKK